MQFIDTHSHLYSEEFNQDIDLCIKRAIENGVTKMLLPNIDEKSIDKIFALCDMHKEFYPMLGLHPTEIKGDGNAQLSIIEKAFSQRKIYAIGEVGLDFYWDRSNEETQMRVFEKQINWSIDKHLPLNLHIRKAVAETIKLLKEIKKNRGIETFNGVFHCFSGDERQSKEVIDLGFKLGVGGVVTFKKAKLAEIVKQTDIKDIVLETDCPYLTPMPHRGERNESSFIPFIAQKIAEIKELSLKEVAEQTTLTAQQIYNL